MPPRGWDDACEFEAAAGQRQLWNALVSLEDQRRRGEETLYRTDQQLAHILDQLDAIAARLRVIPRRGAVQAERDERRALFTERSMLWAQAKPLRAALRRAKESEFRQLYDRRYAAITTARQQSGLWWCNYNAVCAAFDVAVARLGLGENVRRHESDNGDARLVNQIQNGVRVRDFLAHGHAQVRLDPLPTDDRLLMRGAGVRGKLQLLSVTVHSAGRGTRKTATFPIVWHRDLPGEESIIKQIVVQRRRIADTGPHRDRWQAIFTCSVIPDELPDNAARHHHLAIDSEAAGTMQIAGIDLGWRLVDGGVRVATLAGTDEVEDCIVLPRRLIERRSRLAELASAARHQLNRIARALGVAETRAAVKAALEPGPMPDDARELIRLDRAIAHGLDEWASERREFYRIAAKGIAEKYRFVANDGQIKTLARRRLDAAPELPPMARRMRSWAAPGELAREIARAVEARGGQVLYARGRSTAVCHKCRYDNTPVPRDWRIAVFWRCHGCGELWDQDLNAARNLCTGAVVQLSAPEAIGVDAAITFAVKENKGLRRSRLTRKSERSQIAAEPIDKGR